MCTHGCTCIFFSLYTHGHIRHVYQNCVKIHLFEVCRATTIHAIYVTWPCPGGPLVVEVEYHPRKKIHVIRVVFQDQLMYARTSYRGAKTFKIWKRVCFWSWSQILEKWWLKMKKTTCKNRYLGSIVIPGKYMLGVCFESPFTRMISSLKY